MNKEIDESVKFTWAFLLQYGKITTGEWSFYGGHWEEKNPSWNHEEIKEKQKIFIDQVLNEGIDWEKTEIPSVSSEGVFTDTFDTGPGTNCLATLGKLVLKNGETYLIGSSDDDAAHLAETARQLINKKKSAVMELAMKL